MEEDKETDEEDDDLKQTVDIGKYGPCPKCFGWILQKSVKRHMKTCSSDLPLTGTKSSLILQSDILLGKIPEGASQALTTEVFPIMQVDNVSDVAKKDDLIINLGNQWMMRNRGNPIMRKYYTSSSMRLSAKMKLQCQALTKNSTGTLDDFFKPSCFDDIVQASLNCCNVDELDEENLNAPSNAIKLGHDIKRMLSAKLAKSIRNGNDLKMKQAEEFRKLMEIEWGLRVAKLARTLLAERSFNSEHRLPLPEDVKKLASFLQEEIEGLQLDNMSFSNFRKTAILTLARITLFNRRRCHEVQAMKLTAYAARKMGIDSVGQELRGELTKFESHLLHSQEMVIIRGKTGRGVPVILPRDVKEPLCFLADSNVRKEAGILSSNQYLFANAGAGVFRAYDAIRELTRDPRAGLSSPDLIRTSNMRKYMATMVQAMSTDESQKQWIIDHLGHTMDVHTVHYRQTSDVLERIDVAKILLIQDLGLVGQFRGKRLDEIQLDEIMEVQADVDVTPPSTLDQPFNRKRPPVQTPELDEDFIPDITEIDEEEEEYEPIPKKRRMQAHQPSVRQKWTSEEEQELKSLFKQNFKDDKLPGQKLIESMMRKSKLQKGQIHLRKRDNIKKKLSNMMIKLRGSNL